jgi:hypothetical protein
VLVDFDLTFELVGRRRGCERMRARRRRAHQSNNQKFEYHAPRANHSDLKTCLMRRDHDLANFLPSHHALFTDPSKIIVPAVS